MSFDNAKIYSYFELSTTIAKKFTKNVQKKLFYAIENDKLQTRLCKMGFLVVLPGLFYYTLFIYRIFSVNCGVMCCIIAFYGYLKECIALCLCAHSHLIKVLSLTFVLFN